MSTVDLHDYSLKKPSTSTSTKKELTVDVDVDKLTGMLREKVKDPYLGKAFIKKAVGVMLERELNEIAEFALREGNHPGRLFVSVCTSVMKERGVAFKKKYSYSRGLDK